MFRLLVQLFVSQGIETVYEHDDEAQNAQILKNAKFAYLISSKIIEQFFGAVFHYHDELRTIVLPRMRKYSK
jgi:hypothetical protein